MKKTISILFLYLFCWCTFSVQAEDTLEDGIYWLSMSSLDGYLGLGSAHDVAPYIYYVTGEEEMTADAYWKIEHSELGYTFCNVSTGQWLVFTDGRVDQYYKYMTLADQKPQGEDEITCYWNIIPYDDKVVCIQSVAKPSYYWNLRSGSYMMGTYAGNSRSWNEQLIIRKKGDGDTPVVPVDPVDPVNPVEPTQMTKFPDAFHVFLNDGRLDAYPLDIVTDHREANGQLIIETQMGQTFTYALSDVKSTSETAPDDFPTFESYKFNNKYNDQLFTDAIGEMVDDTVFVSIAAIGKRLTASFKVDDDLSEVYVDGVQQESKVTRLRFDKDIYYVVTLPGYQMLLPQETDTKGTTTYAMQPYGRMVRVHVDWLTDRADVPRIDIYTEDGLPITSKTEFKNATITIDGKGIFPSMETTDMQIKGRGNSSWGWAKKPYRLKFEEKVKPLGMTKGKNWVLLANGQTGSLMSNAIGMKAANLMGASAANHIVPVELYLNGEYRGSYNLTEKVGLSNNSIDLSDETAAALLELDSYYDEPEGQKFYSSPYNLPINIKEPDFSEGLTSLTLDMVQKDFNSFLRTLYLGQDISKHVDVEQLVRYLMVNELILNYEFYHPKSTFCYRESFESKDSKYVFGPVWDLDWSFGYEKNRNYFQYEATNNYWINMPNFEVKEFVQSLRFNYEPMGELYRTLWEKFMQNDLTELLEYCQDYYDFAHNSFDHNRELWGDKTNYEQQAKDAADWLAARTQQIYDDIVNDVRPDKPQPVEPVYFANNELYTITCKRGALVLNEDHTGLDVGQIRTDAPEEDKRFAIINFLGNNYLYSPVTEMFLAYNNNGTWVPSLGSPITFDSSHADGEYLYMMSTTTETGKTLYFNNSTTSLVINTWNKPDDGDRWLIEAVDDFDPTEALALAERDLLAVTFNVMFNGNVVATESQKVTYGTVLPEPSKTLSNDFVSLQEPSSMPFTVTEDVTLNYEAVWNGPFKFSFSEDDAVWYNMDIRSGYYVGKQDQEPYKPSIVEELTLLEPEYQWAFGGDPYHVKLYNRSTGFAETLTMDGDNAVMRAGDYTWDLLPNGDGFVLRVTGTPYTCINQFGGSSGPLQFWTDSSSPTDNGSTFHVEEADEGLMVSLEDLTAKRKTETPAIYDLSGRRLNGIERAGIYIINGKKVVVK